MKEEKHKTADTPVSESRSTSSSLLLSLADTTWRMFVPTVGMLLLGRYADTKFDTKPWMMLAGAVAGGAIAALLVSRQLRALNSERTM